MSGAPLDGGHAERANGVASAAGVEFACGNIAEDEEKDTIDAAHEDVTEGDEAGTPSWKMQTPCWKCFPDRPKVL